MRHAGRAFLDLVFPRSCDSCGKCLDGRTERLCAPCAKALAELVGPDYCRRCGLEIGPYLLQDGYCPECAHRRPKLRHFVRVGRYQDPLRRMIIAFKSNPMLDRSLGDLLAEAVAHDPRTSSVDLFVPVPSATARWFHRGGRPPHLLARHVAVRLNRPVEIVVEFARRVRPQVGLSAPERVENVRNAFRIAPGRRVEGRSICLVDDVSTTGATLRECARVLLDAGASRVVGAVLAKARPAVGPFDPGYVGEPWPAPA